LIDFSARQADFYNPFGIGSKFSLVLVIFAEVFCGLFIVLGLFTRLAVIPLIITMLVVIFGANAAKPIIESELAILFLAAFTLILFCGPGKISVDNMMH
jgi:putative oxidoreductase